VCIRTYRVYACTYIFVCIRMKVRRSRFAPVVVTWHHLCGWLQCVYVYIDVLYIYIYIYMYICIYIFINIYYIYIYIYIYTQIYIYIYIYIYTYIYMYILHPCIYTYICVYISVLMWSIYVHVNANVCEWRSIEAGVHATHSCVWLRYTSNLCINFVEVSCVCLFHRFLFMYLGLFHRSLFKSSGSPVFKRGVTS